MAGWSIDCEGIDIGQEPPRGLKLRAWGNSLIMILALTPAPELAKLISLKLQMLILLWN